MFRRCEEKVNGVKSHSWGEWWELVLDRMEGVTCEVGFEGMGTFFGGLGSAVQSKGFKVETSLVFKEHESHYAVVRQ